jgi:signal peptidase I
MISPLADHPKQVFSSQTLRLRGLFRFVLELGLIFLMVTVGESAIAEPYYVPSGSMEPTVKIGDELLASKYNYGYSTASLPPLMHFPVSNRVFGALPRRGDVVVFRAPADPSQIWVKRVIGLPEDRIAIRHGRVWINGKPVGLQPDGLGNDDGTSRLVPRFVETLPGGRRHLILQNSIDGLMANMAAIVVPPGRLFVMGDNRDNSDDSRVPVTLGGVGLLPIGNLVGRVDVLLGSWNPAAKHRPVWQWPSGFRLSRFFMPVR